MRKIGPLNLPERPDFSEGICRLHPHGQCTLVDAVDLVAAAIAYCREHGIRKLLVDVTGLSGIAIPSLVDRFLMAEEWAQRAESMVVVALVVHREYIHPKRFGVRVAADFGLVADVYTGVDDALKWLRNEVDPMRQPA
ncbi:MAG: hypothetical protein ABI624_25170 [Casimicrobiaceae bacterium]